jgi:hypothetical protein
MWVEAHVCSRKQGRTRLSVRVVTQSPRSRAIRRALELAALTSRGLGAIHQSKSPRGWYWHHLSPPVPQDHPQLNRQDIKKLLVL